MSDKKNPACEDRCQLLELHGYITCAQAGSCQWVEGFDAQRARALEVSLRESAYADAMGYRDRTAILEGSKHSTRNYNTTRPEFNPPTPKAQR